MSLTSAALVVRALVIPIAASALTGRKVEDTATHRRAIWPTASRSPAETRSEP